MKSATQGPDFVEQIQNSVRKVSFYDTFRTVRILGNTIRGNQTIPKRLKLVKRFSIRREKSECAEVGVTLHSRGSGAYVVRESPRGIPPPLDPGI